MKSDTITIPIADVDYPKLAECYARLKWRWSRCGIPSASDLAEVVARLVSEIGEEVELYNGGHHILSNVGTGGITTDGINIWLDSKLEHEYFRGVAHETSTVPSPKT